MSKKNVLTFSTNFFSHRLTNCLDFRFTSNLFQIDILLLFFALTVGNLEFGNTLYHILFKFGTIGFNFSALFPCFCFTVVFIYIGYLKGISQKIELKKQTLINFLLNFLQNNNIPWFHRLTFSIQRHNYKLPLEHI